MEETKKIKISKWIALVLGILTIIGLGIYLYFSLKPEKTTQTTTPSQTSEKRDESTSTTATPSCTSAFSNDEKEMLKSFVSYTGKAYNLTFKHPSDWTKIFQEDKYILMSGEGNSLTFRITIADRAAVNTEEFNKVSTKNITVACIPTTETYYHGYGLSDGVGKNIVEIKKNNIPFVIEMSYPDNMGASISSDYIELFDLILKTLEIK